jgi:hypothetical protein
MPLHHYPSTTASPVPSLTVNHLRDIAVLKTYGAAPYANALKKLEKQIKDRQASVNEKIGVKVRNPSYALW